MINIINMKVYLWKGRQVLHTNVFFHFSMVQSKMKYKYLMTGKPVSVCHSADAILEKKVKSELWNSYLFIYIKTIT